MSTPAISGPTSLRRDALRQGGVLLLLAGLGWAVWGPVRARVLEPPAPAAAAFVDSALALMQRHSYRRRAIDWPALRAATLRRAAGAATPGDAAGAVEYAVRALGDHHSFLMSAESARAWAAAGAANPAPRVVLLGGGLGYVAVPSYVGGDSAAAAAYAARLAAALVGAAPATPCGWVVDLRANGGGNLWPMLGGLRPLLGAAPLGAFVDADGRRTRVWVAPPAALEARSEDSAPLTERAVAVLTGPRTASAGEAVAVAFRGRARTRAFGAPTAGLSSANHDFALPGGATLWLTVAVDADRTGRVYGGALAPDVPVADRRAPGADPADPADATARAGAAWVRAQSGCGVAAP